MKRQRRDDGERGTQKITIARPVTDDEKYAIDILTEGERLIVLVRAGIEKARIAANMQTPEVTISSTAQLTSGKRPAQSSKKKQK
jgi:hypothetical protein